MLIDGNVHQETDDRLVSFLTSEGIQFGFGLFETMRSRNGLLEDFELHMKRLWHSASALGLDLTSDLKDHEKLMERIAADPYFPKEGLASVKLVVTKDNDSVKWWTQYRKFPYRISHYQEGFSVCLSHVTRNSTSSLVRHKTTCYAESWLERQKAVENGYQEVLFLNESGYLSEGSVSNIFIRKDGVWSTPAICNGLLPGIMRKRMIEGLSQYGMECHESNLSWQDLLDSDLILLTNSLMGIMPVKRVHEKTFRLPEESTMKVIRQIDPLCDYFME